MLAEHAKPSRNTSKESLASHITRRWESFSGYAKVHLNSASPIWQSERRNGYLTLSSSAIGNSTLPLLQSRYPLKHLLNHEPTPPNLSRMAARQLPRTEKKPIRVSFLTEQTSHHPPVSAYWYACPQLGISARGYDQISAKFTGTSVRVDPGVFNRGIFINLAQRNNEEYQLVHPAASLGGLLRGNLYISVADTCSITCPQTRQKCLLTYVEESWFGKAPK